MNPPATKVYIGCALTYASKEFMAEVESFKDSLRLKGYKVLDFYGLHTAGTPKDVYINDISKCVKDCDVFIGICDYPSIGLGYELAEANRQGKAVLALANKDTVVTRLILGAADVEPNFSFVRYSALSKDGVRLASDWMKSASAA